MKRAAQILEELKDEFYRDLIDAISMRHGYGFTEPTFHEVTRWLSSEDWAAAKVIAKIEGRPMGAVVADAIASVYVSTEPDSEAEAQRIWETELVPLEAALRLPEPKALVS